MADSAERAPKRAVPASLTPPRRACRLHWAPPTAISFPSLYRRFDKMRTSPKPSRKDTGYLFTALCPPGLPDVPMVLAGDIPGGDLFSRQGHAVIPCQNEDLLLRRNSALGAQFHPLGSGDSPVENYFVRLASRRSVVSRKPDVGEFASFVPTQFHPVGTFIPSPQGDSRVLRATHRGREGRTRGLAPYLRLP